MSASPNDVAFGCDVVPTAQWANITSLRPLGATSLWAKRITSFLRKQKHHFFTARQDNYVLHTIPCKARLYAKRTRNRVFLILIWNCFIAGAPKQVLFSMKRTYGAWKMKQGFALWCEPSAHGEVSVRFASCLRSKRIIRALRVLHRSRMTSASYRQSRCFIKKYKSCHFDL